MARTIGALFIACSMASCLAVTSAYGATGGGRVPRDDLAERIQGLIERLGAPQYAVRERAQEELAELGVVAFDALLAAGLHDDIEIAMRARYLVRRLPIRWTTSKDPESVRSVLRRYATAGRDERLNRMQQLAALSDSSGVLALCRIMRYEVDPQLSKQAALAAMGHARPQDEEVRITLAEQIVNSVEASSRPAALWLKAYASSLVEPEASLPEWERLIELERHTFAQFPHRTERRIVRDLLRWHADQLWNLERRPEFLQAVRDALSFVEGRWQELFDFVDWSLEREAWTAVDEVAARFPTEFHSHAGLVYRLAEAQLRRGDPELAGKTAQAALAIDPDDPNEHAIRAERLQARLMYPWAEQEYRHVVKITEPAPNNPLHLQVRFYLADMLFDLEREVDAAEVLAEAVKQIDENPKLVKPIRRSEVEVRSLLEYYRAMGFGRQGEFEKQKEHLERAFATYTGNPDFLIAMYHVPASDPLWKQQVSDRIEAAVMNLEQRVGKQEQIVRNSQDGIKRLSAIDNLSSALNELAWLIGNTKGDTTKAIQYSQRSLQLKPNSPAYLDTLGRCFFAAGDYESAVQHQARAVEGAPYYQQIRRQLKLFENALASSNE